MSNRMLAVFAVAVLVAAGVALGVRSWLGGNQPQAPVSAEQTPTSAGRILIAKRDMSPGTFVNPATDLEWMEWPVDNIREFHLREGVVNLNDYHGSVVRRKLQTGDPLTEGALVKRGAGGFMPAVLEPGKRAVSIAVSPISGNAGFVSPGDYVDLILTHRVRLADIGGAQSESVISETFVENVRVIAVDQQLENPENKAILAKTLTVEVSQKEAEKIAVAQDLGHISVALRSLAVTEKDKDQAKKQEAADNQQTVVDPFFMDEIKVPGEHPDVTSDRDTSKALSNSSEVSPRVKVIRGEKVETLRFYRSDQ